MTRSICVKVSNEPYLHKLSHSGLSAARTTSPISSTGTYKPSVHAPSWCSRATTPVIPSGWATQRRPPCGTMTPCALTGGVPTRPWKGPRRRPTCCRVPTEMSFSAERTSPSGGPAGQKATRSEGQTLRRGSVLTLHTTDVLSVF